VRNVVFVAPYPLETTLTFCNAIATLGDVRLLGIFQQAPQKGGFSDVALIQNSFDPQQVVDAARKLAAKHGPIHRILGVLEDLQVAIAAAREALGLPGMSVEATKRFRDKALMKDTLRAAGLPVARHKRLHSDNDAWSFVDDVGFPIVLKPPAGAGCRATYRVDSPSDLTQALSESQPSPHREVLAEEFLSGREYSFETISVGGEPMFHSIGRYFPGPLEVMRTDWIQWVVHLPRVITTPEFDDTRKIGFAALKALGMTSGITHMEWFRRGDGSMAIGEIAARPPGAQIVRLMSWAHDVDMHRAWARAAVDEAFDGPFERKYSVGVAFLRGEGTGRVASIENLDEAQKRMGALVVEARLPKVGMPRAEGYEGEGWAIVRHKDDEVVKNAILELIRTVKIKYA